MLQQNYPWKDHAVHKRQAGKIMGRVNASEGLGCILQPFLFLLSDIHSRDSLWKVEATNLWTASLASAEASSPDKVRL